MRTSSLAAAKAHLSSLVDDAEHRGKSTVILRHGKPVVQASIHRFEGQLLTIDPNSPGGCLRCLWPAPPPEGLIGNCAEVGVLGVTPGLFGTLQASEALKIILGLPGVLDRHLLIMDALSLETRRIARRRDADCPICGATVEDCQCDPDDYQAVLMEARHA